MKGNIFRAGAVLLIWLALVWPVPQSLYNRLTLALSDYMHFPLAILLFRLISGRVRSPRLTAAIVLLAAAAMECIQPLLGRSASIADFAYAALGVVAGAMLFRLPKLKTAFSLLCVLALIPVGSVILDQCSARRDFPLLAGFESPLEKGRWTLNGVSMKRSPENSTQGRFAAEVSVSEKDFDYPGLFLEDMPRDWRDADALRFDVFWPADGPRELCVRMDDQKYNPAYRDRFQKSFVLNPGMNRIRINREEYGLTSGGAPLDLSHVMRMGLFFLSAEKGEAFFLDDVKLLKGEE